MAKKTNPTRAATRAAVAEAAQASDPRHALEGPSRPSRRPTDVFLGEVRRRDVFPLLVLHYCSREPCYGNQLIDRIEAATAGVMQANPNTIYPLLRDLESRGLVEGEWEHPEKRSRRFYRATPAGVAEYERLRAAVEPFLDSIVETVRHLKKEIYGNG